MRNELQRHKRSDKVKWVLTGIMFFLAFVMITGLLLQVFGTGKAKPSEWFKKQDSEQTEQLPAEGGENSTAHTRVKAMAATLSAESDMGENGVMPLLSTSDWQEEDSVVAVYWENKQYTSWNGIHFMFRATIKGELRNNTFVIVNTAIIPDIMAETFGTFNYEITFNSGTVFTVSLRLIERDDGSYYLFGESGMSTIETSGVSDCRLIVEKKTVPLPDDPVKEGHTFVGWYYDSEFTRPYDGSPIYADTQLYAKFEINKFTVTFNSDGGSSVVSQTVNWNTAATLTTPTREKYAFKGWFLPNGTRYTNQPIKENTTLTAHWERNVFNITFNTDGGTVVENTEVNLNTPISLPTTTKTGYVFKGWFLENGTQYTNQPVTDDMALTAHWEIQTFTVTFYVDGEVYATKTVEYGQGLAKVAETVNLKMFSVRMESGMPTFDESGAVIVTENCSVEAQEMSDMDKAINTVKENKWAIIGGVAGGIALIAVIAAVCGGAKRKRRR